MPRPSPTTLLVLAKHPVPGQVKTRLAAVIGNEAAARLAAAFLEDTLDQVATLADRRLLGTWPDDPAAEVYFAEIAAGRFELWPQPAGSLGDRLAAAFAEHRAGDRAREDGRMVVIGADSPTLPRERVADAFAALEHHDVVLGPATDGGYYLLGQRRLVPGLFEGIDWSTPQVLAQTMARLEAARVTPALLPAWYDVDTHDDLLALAKHLRTLDATGQGRAGGAGRSGGVAPATSRAMAAVLQSPAAAGDWDTPAQDAPL